MRKRKCGETSIASIASWMPCSVVCPSAFAIFTNRRRPFTSAGVTGRRYALRASVATIFCTHAALVFGSQVRIFLRLGRSAAALYGPRNVMELIHLFFLLL